DYFDLQGIVAFNSSAGVVVLEPDGPDHPTYNSLRRISAYNTAATCTTPGGSVCNHQLFELWNADHTLIEECAAAGRARSIAYAFQSSYTTWRRCWFRGDQGNGVELGHPGSRRLCELPSRSRHLREQHPSPIPRR